MNNRSPLLLLSMALGGCLILLVCLAVIGLGGYFWVNHTSLFATTGAVANRIAYLGNDLNIYIVDPKGGEPLALTKDGDGATTHAYEYPTWSPDNRRIAFLGINYSGNSATDATLYSVTPNGETRTELFKSKEHFPFYLYWSPDSRLVGFLTAKTQTNLALNVARPDQPDSAEEVENGQPLYWAWSPDGKQVFMHSGGARADSANARLALLPIGDKSSAQPLSSNPGSFLAPQWSPDGQHLLFSTQDASRKEALAIANPRGEEAKVLFNYDGRISFAWSPAGNRIAFIVTPSNAELPNYGQVRVMDAQGGNPAEIANENALALYWSPSGKRLAYLTVLLNPNGSSKGSGGRFPGLARQGEARLQLQWKVKDFETDQTHTVATFVPTREFISVLPYFDQYGLSMTFWSPDSESMVYSNRETASSGTIWVGNVSGEAAHQIGEGLIGFWSWK